MGRSTTENYGQSYNKPSELSGWSFEILKQIRKNTGSSNGEVMMILES